MRPVRERVRTLLLVSAMTTAVGCNVILGNEDGFFDPSFDATDESPRSDAPISDVALPDASIDAGEDRSVGIDTPAGDRLLPDLSSDNRTSDTRVEEAASDQVATDRAPDQNDGTARDMSVGDLMLDTDGAADRSDTQADADDGLDVADVSDAREEPCVPPTGTPCGNCGGTVKCDGSCSVPTPTDYGQPCGSCGGTVKCDSTCSVPTPTDYGQPCGSCGGTVKCDSTCSVPTPTDYGQPCGSCGGTVKCDSTCSVATPGNFGQPCGLCNGTILCSGACSNLGDPNNCSTGRCGLGCSGTCTCGTGQVCNSNSLTCVHTCSGGQRCCEPIQGGGCSICVGGTQQCP